MFAKGGKCCLDPRPGEIIRCLAMELQQKSNFMLYYISVLMEIIILEHVV